MFSDINAWVASCKTCRQFKDTQPLSHGYLIPIISTHPFEIVGVDISGPYEKSKNGFKYILVCVDHFTSWVEAAPMKSITANEVIETFLRIIISRHGCPQKLITDEGRQFISKTFQNLCKEFNIEHIQTTAYHQQANGKTEKFMKFMNDTISTALSNQYKNWDYFLDLCLLTYRVTLNRTLNDTPFYLIYARDPILPQDLQTHVKLKNLRNLSDTDVAKVKRY